jgi:tetratricopeptide (TPR) repeat protein
MVYDLETPSQLYYIIGGCMLARHVHSKRNKKKPDLAVLWNNKGAEFFRNNRLEEAKAAFHQAKEIKPDLVPALYNLASVCVLEGKRKEAIFHLKKVIETDPSFRNTVKKSSYFETLRNDEDFRRIVH